MPRGRLKSTADINRVCRRKIDARVLPVELKPNARPPQVYFISGH